MKIGYTHIKLLIGSNKIQNLVHYIRFKEGDLKMSNNKNNNNDEVKKDEVKKSMILGKLPEETKNIKSLFKRFKNRGSKKSDDLSK